jgi:hypothetical protein
MQEQPVTLGDVIDQFREVFGTGRWRRIVMPTFLLDLGARLGDLASLFGWMPPMRTTAIAELRRGVAATRRMDGRHRHRAEAHRTDGRKTPGRPSRTNGLPGCSRSRRLSSQASCCSGSCRASLRW